MTSPLRFRQPTLLPVAGKVAYTAPPGSTPAYLAIGRINFPIACCSRACASHPASRPAANITMDGVAGEQAGEEFGGTGIAVRVEGVAED